MSTNAVFVCKDGVRIFACGCETTVLNNKVASRQQCDVHKKEESMDGQALKSGVKKDEGKARMDLLPMDALLEVAKVLTFGATKYGDRNWEQGIAEGRIRAAKLRHHAQDALGNRLDEETGLAHKAHEACNALMDLALYLRGHYDRNEGHNESK